MNINFSAHAEYQLQLRRISTSAVCQVIVKPDKVVRQNMKRYRASKIFGVLQRWYAIVVVYEIDDARITVITAWRTSKIEKYV